MNSKRITGCSKRFQQYEFFHQVYHINKDTKKPIHVQEIPVHSVEQGNMHQISADRTATGFYANALSLLPFGGNNWTTFLNSAIKIVAINDGGLRRFESLKCFIIFT